MRVVTFNVAGGRSDQFDDLLAILRALRPDVAALTEADEPQVAAELAAALKMEHAWGRGSGSHHLATLSRFPIRHWQIHNRKPLTQGALATTLDARPLLERPLTVYNVHLRPDPFWHYELFRWLAAGRLLAVIRRRPAGPALIAGDLNTYAPGDTVELDVILRHMNERDRRRLALQGHRFLRLSLRRLLRAGFVDCFRRLHPAEPGYTSSRHGAPISRVDYILAGSELAPALRCCAVAADLPPVAATSDHRPLVADFGF